MVRPCGPAQATDSAGGVPLERPGATYTVLTAAELRPSGGGDGGGGGGGGGGGAPGVQGVSGALFGNGLLVLQVR